MNTVIFKTAKAFHIAGLVVWLGPSAGGYLLVLLARMQGEGEVAVWLSREYLYLICLEAFGLSILLATGLFMRLSAPALREARWLKAKLAIVFIVFVPFEAAQLFIYQVIVVPALISGTGADKALFVFDRFSAIAAAALATAVPAVFFLAVFKPELHKKR